MRMRKRAFDRLSGERDAKSQKAAPEAEKGETTMASLLREAMAKQN
jgi:small subunit ribosomal protein S1